MVSTFSIRDWDEKAGSMLTFTREWVDPADPVATHIQIEDIAHALARICRYGGHLETTYTVAEHSMNVAAQLYRTTGDFEYAQAGLFHDAAEAYLGDVIRPVKDVLPGYHELEERMMTAIRARFRLTDDVKVWKLVKQADEEILPWEMAIYRHSLAPRIAPPAADIAAAFIKAARRYRVPRLDVRYGERVMS
jgi:5'-deoxynucleotidase YfbR-like HD superfamily hydrolase